MIIWGAGEEETRLFKSILIILRVPGLILLDLWWMERSAASIPQSLEMLHIADAGVNLSLLVLSLWFLLVPLEELVVLYMNLLSAVLLFLVHLVVQEVVLPPSTSPLLSQSTYSQVCLVGMIALLSLVVRYCLELEHRTGLLYPGLYGCPLLLGALGAEAAWQEWTLRCVDTFTILSVVYYAVLRLPEVIFYLKEVTFLYGTAYEESGMFSLVVLGVSRALQPPVLAAYWGFLFIAQFWNNFFELEKKDFIVDSEDCFTDLVIVVAEICESQLILLAFSLTIMYLSKAVLESVEWVLTQCGSATTPENSLAQTGVAEGVIAFVLALQTELTDLEILQRIQAMSVLLFIVLGSFLQSLFEVAGPGLLALPATNRRPIRHLPALFLTLLLIVFPIQMLSFILSKVATSVWILIVISSFLVTVIQAAGSLATYSLLMWDSLQETSSESMDDYLFYAKAVAKCLEFLVATAIVVGGLYECLYYDEELSLLNLGILCIHFYCNVFVRLSQGWRTLLARRKTFRKLSLLEDASKEELEQHNDVCSICYQDMAAAKKTNCAHFFHAACLKRWLFVQDNCPLCTASILHTSTPPAPESPSSPPAAAATAPESPSSPPPAAAATAHRDASLHDSRTADVTAPADGIESADLNHEFLPTGSVAADGESTSMAARSDASAHLPEWADTGRETTTTTNSYVAESGTDGVRHRVVDIATR